MIPLDEMPILRIDGKIDIGKIERYRKG